MTDSRQTRLATLDAVRGVAAMMVVLFHYTAHYSHVMSVDYDPAVSVGWGYLGVNFFFMVSGFVIFMTLEKTRNGADFIVSRFSRLYPAFWFAVLLTAVVVNAYGLKGAQRSVGEILVNLTMLQDFVRVQRVDGVYWTLTYELIFYAWMYLLFHFRQLARIEWFVAGWLVLATGSHICELVFNYFPWKITLFLLLQYAHLFAAGILFFLVFSGRATRLTWALIALCLANQFLVSAYWWETPFVVAFFGVFWLICLNRASFLNARILVFFGGISYTLYLLHQNLGFVLLDWLRRAGLNPNLAVPIAIAAAILLAWLVSRFLEKPAMKAIRQRYKSHEPRPAVAS